MPKRTRQEFLVERHAYTSVVLYEITGEDLEQLEKETLTLSEDFSFGLAALSVAASFTVALATTEIPSNRTFNVFWIVTIIGYLATAFFGVRWFRGRRHVTGAIKRIKERAGPLGEEGKEIDQAELASLAPQAAPTDQQQGGR